MPGCGGSPGTKLSSRSEFNAAKASRGGLRVFGSEGLRTIVRGLLIIRLSHMAWPLRALSPSLFVDPWRISAC